MSQPMSVAASLPPTSRKSLAIEVLSKAEPVSHLAAQHQGAPEVPLPTGAQSKWGAGCCLQFRHR